MNQFAVAKDFYVVCKDANFGSWYSDCCFQCANYPYHDALMAIRVTPANSFRFWQLQAHYRKIYSI